MKNITLQKLAGTFLLLSLVMLTFAQDKTLVGKITAFDSIPLSGVNIQVGSSGLEVLTDSLGRFQTFCNPKDKIKIRADGFYSKTVKIKDDIRMVLVNIDLKKGQDNLAKAERYVQVGYGTVSSKDLLYSVSSANTNDIDFSKYDDLYDAIQGQFPGVMVEGGQIIVRGTTTLNGIEGSGALIVVDGAISNGRDFATINPIDVQSIDVLKDGSSSIYGSRGANGVVIVKTQNGNI